LTCKLGDNQEGVETHVEETQKQPENTYFKEKRVNCYAYKKGLLESSFFYEIKWSTESEMKQ
jgi:hypothetical protein